MNLKPKPHIRLLVRHNPLTRELEWRARAEKSGSQYFIEMITWAPSALEALRGLGQNLNEDLE